MTPIKTIQAGTQAAWFGRLDSEARFTDISGSMSHSTQLVGMQRILGIQSANPAPADTADVPVPGDDGILGQFTFEPDTLTAFDVLAGVFDLTQQAALQGTLVESFGEGYIGVMQPTAPDFIDICVIIQGRSKSQDSATRGLKAWSGILVPLAQGIPRGRESWQGRTAGADRLKVSPQVAAKKPWGVTITNTINGTDSAPLMPFTFDNPITLVGGIGNGVVTTFTLPEGVTPISAAKSPFLVGTTPITPASVNTANRTVTFSVAPGNGVKFTGVIEYQP